MKISTRHTSGKESRAVSAVIHVELHDSRKERDIILK